MKETRETLEATREAQPAPSAESRSRPGLVLVWKPQDLLVDDRAPLSEAELTVGRSSQSTWCIRDPLLSRQHFSVTASVSGVVVRDLGSRNGLTVNGTQLVGEARGNFGAVIRAGGCVFLVVRDLDALAPPGLALDHTLMAGKFHAGILVRQLRVAARTGRHVLLEGESGTGKELAARLLHATWVELGRKGPYCAHNAAHFAGEGDAIGNLFGVAHRAYTGVEPRRGGLEVAQGGTFFLDEVHALPSRVQQSLLRFAEDGVLLPLGAPPAQSARICDVRLVLATNLDVDQACENGALGHDLVARLHRCRLSPLRERREDIPSIFVHLAQSLLGEEGARSLIQSLDAENVERLCLSDHRRGNVRDLQALVALVGARVAEGEAMGRALRQTVFESVEPSPSMPVIDSPEDAAPSRSLYETHREDIVASYREVGGNLSQLEKLLHQRGIPCTRRWLAVFLERWGLRPIRKKS